MATPGLLKVEVFWNKGYYVTYSVYDVTNKILSHDSNYIVDAVIRPKFRNSSICIREVIVTSILLRIWPEKRLFFEGMSWFKFIDLRLALGTNLKFYTSFSKGLKLKVKKFCRLTFMFIEVTGEKLVGFFFCNPPPPASPIPNRVNNK